MKCIMRKLQINRTNIVLCFILLESRIVTFVSHKPFPNFTFQTPQIGPQLVSLKMLIFLSMLGCPENGYLKPDVIECFGNCETFAHFDL